jgi:hypothetical protein
MIIGTKKPFVRFQFSAIKVIIIGAKYFKILTLWSDS